MQRLIKKCESIKNIKLVILDLYTNGKSHQQVTTSSTIEGNLTDLVIEADRLKTALTKHGYSIIREKYETVTQNPIIEKSLAFSYIESHISFLVNDDELKSLHQLVLDHDMKLSKNTLKHNVDGIHKIMGTLRTYTSSLDFHNERLASTLQYVNRYKIKKYITEFAFYDSNTALDDDWLSNCGEQSC
jgi:hypothetical protein